MKLTMYKTESADMIERIHNRLLRVKSLQRDDAASIATLHARQTNLAPQWTSQNMEQFEDNEAPPTVDRRRRRRRSCPCHGHCHRRRYSLPGVARGSGGSAES